MPNLSNYTSDLIELRDKYNRYTVSRVLTSTVEDLLEIEVPSDIQEDYFVEMSLYSFVDNSRIFSTVINPLDNEDIFKLVTLSYPDSSVRRLLFIDFSKIPNLIIPDGRFEAVFNFFNPEIGSATIKPLTITRISPSRTEIEVKLAPQYRISQIADTLTTFASPQINSKWILDTFKYICNQTQSLDTKIPTDTTLLTFDIIQSFLPISESNKLNSPNTAGVQTASIKDNTQQLLNNTYRYVSQSLQEAVFSQSRFTNDAIVNIFSSSLSKAMRDYNNLQTTYFKFV